MPLRKLIEASLYVLRNCTMCLGVGLGFFVVVFAFQLFEVIIAESFQFKDACTSDLGSFLRISFLRLFSVLFFLMPITDAP